MRRRLAVLLGILSICALTTVGSSCDEGNKSAEELRRDSIEHRTEVFQQAEQRFALPKPQNFPLREALVKYTERQDLVNHPWYIYILAPIDGRPLGYFVGKTYPQNICNFLSSTEEVRVYDQDGVAVLTAPSLDGIYYGGGGAKGTCDAWFFFDVTTDTMQVISGLPYFVSDAPLALNVPRFEVQR